jgi:hypothetical protein
VQKNILGLPGKENLVKAFLLPGVVGLLTVCAGVVLKRLLPHGVSGLVVGIVEMLTIYFVLSLLLRLISADEIKELFSLFRFPRASNTANSVPREQPPSE